MIYPQKVQKSQDVSAHYHHLDQVYRELWGDHLHHGYWETGGESVSEATEKLVGVVAQHAHISQGSRICDVGCGYGATARLLANQWNAEVTAITISDTQFSYICQKDPDSKNPHYVLCDFLKNFPPFHHFDVMISIESSEHMEDKKQFFSKAFNLLKPGGILAICAWLATEKPRQWEIDYLLEPICREGRLPSMGSNQDYQQLMTRAGFEHIHYFDLTDKVKKSWPIAIRRCAKAFFTHSHFRTLFLDRHFAEWSFLKTIFRIPFAYWRKCMLYGLFIASKPLG